jgi:hypothetical protein
MSISLEKRIYSQLTESDWHELVDWVRRLRVVENDLRTLVNDLLSAHPDNKNPDEEED